MNSTKTKRTNRARTKADHEASTTGGRVIDLADVLSGPLATGARRRHVVASSETSPPRPGVGAKTASVQVSRSCLTVCANDLAEELIEMLRLFDAVGAQVVGDFSAEQEAFERRIIGGLRTVNGIREILLASTEGDRPLGDPTVSDDAPAARAGDEVRS